MSCTGVERHVLTPFGPGLLNPSQGTNWLRWRLSHELTGPTLGGWTDSLARRHALAEASKDSTAARQLLEDLRVEISALEDASEMA